ncbi:MAG: thymidine phosphorylase [Myxococcota bacterium]|jgi:pyrimidine-nucleoside phosphorylase|nr:thymidine phosphorylase [Myxococcota bacterium]
MQPNIPEVIRRKRQGEALREEDIRYVISAYSRDELPDYQMAALLMAVFFRGLDETELSVWADAMLHSGEVLDFSDVEGSKVDKHSTGGVGDKVSICLAPAVAACGVRVPMISGRGLGHTGGTLDKLEAIAGFRTDLDVRVARRLLEDFGLFLIGQTAQLAPADKRIYALRDVTGTVESIPLIASSIMSKKLAEGIDALVLDVKVGSGAFMTSIEEARLLAQTLIGIGARAGKRVSALLTDMSRPLGRTVGNALEVEEALEVMRGQGPADTTELTLALGAQMLLLGGAVKQTSEGRERIRDALSSGRALELFGRLVEAQGGDPRVVDDSSKLPTARQTEVIVAENEGFAVEIAPRTVAMAALEVGAGRRRKEDSVDPSTGVIVRVSLGDEVRKGDPLFELRHNGKGADQAKHLLGRAVRLGPSAGSSPPLLLEQL